MEQCTLSLLAVTVLIIGHCVTSVSPHPQCLDFKPPFKTSDGQPFCSQYDDFGCCDLQKKRDLKADFDYIKSQLDPETRALCEAYVEELVCQECSPYAAHIYNAEATLRKSAFPGLCNSYCHDFYTKCKDVVPYFTEDEKILTALQSSSAKFCEEIAISDVDYCYPELLTNTILNQRLINNTKTEDGCLCLEELTGALRNPLLLESPNDGTGRLFIAEQVGLVHIYYKDGSILDEPFMDLTDKVLTSSWRGDERGFLGLTFHPNFKENQRLFVYFSIRNDGEQMIRVSEFRISSDNPNKVDKTSERVILEQSQPYWNHNGGELLFGIDGYLYLFLGDGGGAGDPQYNAQSLDTLLGKVLRIDVDTDPGNKSYVIPPDNPFQDEEEYRKEVYAYGIRNIWRCDVDEGDPQTGYGYGRIICGDVGQDEYEEIDIIEKGGNYGWNTREGFECFSSDCGSIGEEILPIHAYEHKLGKSVTGGHVYRGCQNPALMGQYIYGDYVSGRLFRLKENIETQEWKASEIYMCDEQELCTNGLVGHYEVNILSFGEDDDGEIYMLTTSFPSPKEPKGRVYKLVDPRRRGDPTKCRSYVAPTEATTPPVSRSSYTIIPITTCILLPIVSCVTSYV